MLSLIKKLFAKKTEVSATAWPFPVSKVPVKPADQPVAEVKVEAVSTAKKPVVKKSKVVAKTTPRKPRTPRAQ
jgi:hypothetical protein